ncbi:unnamed protein product [Phytophthora fragariaefolia]|uniref:Unnamed protein product n=1 Tax=Phytophthora fragariaefolia TaxID=1490495 RepID=A0A9W6XNW5_9STRA|nr:unnamed protein product [Phytophthora fragariaefolia]
MQSLNITTAHRSATASANQPTRVLTSGKVAIKTGSQPGFKPSQLTPDGQDAAHVQKDTSDTVSSLDLQSISKELRNTSNNPRSNQPV